MRVEHASSPSSSRPAAPASAGADPGRFEAALNAASERAAARNGAASHADTRPAPSTHRDSRVSHDRPAGADGRSPASGRSPEPHEVAARPGAREDRAPSPPEASAEPPDAGGEAAPQEQIASQGQAVIQETAEGDAAAGTADETELASEEPGTEDGDPAATAAAPGEVPPPPPAAGVAPQTALPAVAGNTGDGAAPIAGPDGSAAIAPGGGVSSGAVQIAAPGASPPDTSAPQAMPGVGGSDLRAGPAKADAASSKPSETNAEPARPVKDGAPSFADSLGGDRILLGDAPSVDPSPPADLPGLDSLQPPAASAPATAGPTAGTAAGTPASAATVPLGAVPLTIGLKALGGDRSFEIRLDPEDLGRIDVRLDIDKEGGVRAHLTVDRVETLALLQRDARTLERAFEQAGLKPSGNGVELSLRDPGNGSGQARQDRNPDGGRNGEPGRPSLAGEAPATVPEALTRQIWRRATGVDLRI